MVLQKILERLCSANKSKHRLTVDCQSADPLFMDGLDLICRMQNKPNSPTTIDIYFTHIESEESVIKSGQYDLLAEVLSAEQTEAGWRVSLRILNSNTELVHRKSDRWKTPIFPIVYQKKNETLKRISRVLDFSAQGIAIERDVPLEIGECVNIFGMSEVMKMPLGESVKFEVRILPTPTKAGLMLTSEASEDLKNAFADFSNQLRQVIRFWNSFLEIIKTITTKAEANAVLPSSDFICRQLRRKEAGLGVLIDLDQFEQLTDCISFLERFQRLKEDLIQLEAEKKSMEPQTNEKNIFLINFIEQFKL